MIARADLSLFGLLAIPGSGTNRYPTSVNLYSRRGQLEAPDGRAIYVRLVASDESSLSSLLTDTAGSALSASASAAFPSSAGWKQVDAGSVEGVFSFEVAVSSATSAAQGRLDVGYRSESEAMQASQSFAISAGASVDLSPVTDAIGAWGDNEDDETVFGAIAGVAEDVAGISLAPVEALIGTPASTLAGDIAAIKAVVGDLGGTGKTLAELLDPLLLAYGTVTVPRVDKITGPGNAYVASAKKRVFGQVGIDMIAGPSEILVLADGSTPPDWVAMDLFSQAEHDEIAQAILLCPDAEFIARVRASIERLLPEMPRQDIIRASLSGRGALIQVADLDEACQIANYIAPEHLELSVAEPAAWLPKLKEMVPSLGVDLSGEPKLYREVWDWGTKVLKLDQPA